MQSEKFSEVGRVDFGPKIMISVLLLLSLRKLWFIQVFMSVRVGENSWSDGFGGDVELSVVSIAVKVKSMAADDVTKWEHVEDEEDGAKH